MRTAIPNDSTRTTPADATSPNPALLGWAEFFQQLGDDARRPFPSTPTP